MAEDRDVIPLSRFTAVLGRPRGSKRLAQILEDPKAIERVAELPVQDLYFLIKEVGIAECEELIALASPEQLQGCLDLDVWDKDHVDDARVRPWLRALIAAGPEKLTQVWSELDPELTALVFKRWTRVYNIAEEDVPEDEEPPLFQTPDRFFVVKVTAGGPRAGSAGRGGGDGQEPPLIDEEDVRLVETLVDRLYRVDAVQARHTLRAAASEPFAELEEQSYRWRSGRMQDLGYAEYGEALEVYRPIDLATLQVGEDTADRPPAPQHLPAVLAGPALAQPFLSRVLAQIVDVAEAQRLETALAMLFNRVLSADRIEPGDAEAAAVGAQRAAATLSLGLETIARADVARGVEALRTISLTRIHRAGHTVTLQLAKLAAVLGQRADRADEPYASMVTALRERRPSMSRLVDEPPAPGTRPFAQTADVRRVAQALAILAAQVTTVFDVIGVVPAAGEAAPQSIDTLARTAIVHIAIGDGISVAPLGRADLQAFRALPAADVRARAEEALRTRAAEKQIVLPPEFPAALDGWMGGLNDLARLKD